MEKHTTLKSVSLTPKNERAAIQISTKAGDLEDSWSSVAPVRVFDPYREVTIKFLQKDFEYRIEYGPSQRKQKLLDAGFSLNKADKILDALGEF